MEHGRGWRIVARIPETGEPVACYHSGRLPGGQVWVHPETWGKLRVARLRLDTSWRLTIDGDEIVRVWPGSGSPTRRFDIVVRACSLDHPELPVLLIALLCWSISAENSIEIPRSGGGEGF